MRIAGSVLESLRAFGAVFRNPNLRRLQLAGAGSTLGTWAYGVAIAVYAYHAGGARAVGILYAVRWGIGAVAAPWFAVLADRTSRRRTMLAADVVRAVLLTGIAVLTFVYCLAVTLITRFAAERMRASPRMAAWLNRVAGTMLLGFGVRLALGK